MDFEEPWRLYSGYNIDAIPQQIGELFSEMFYSKEVRLSNGWDDLATVIKEKFDEIKAPSSEECFFKTKNYFYQKEVADLIRKQVPVASLTRKDYAQLATTYVAANKQGIDLFAEAEKPEFRNRGNEIIMSQRIFEATNEPEVVQEAKEKGAEESSRTYDKVKAYHKTLEVE